MEQSKNIIILSMDCITYSIHMQDKPFLKYVVIVFTGFHPGYEGGGGGGSIALRAYMGVWHA